MGLDQYLYIKHPNLEEGNNRGKEIAYWRKDWSLQSYINSDSSETVDATEDFCKDILLNLDKIYSSSDFYVSDEDVKRTEHAFTYALQLISEGKDIIYEADW